MVTITAVVVTLAQATKAPLLPVTAPGRALLALESRGPIAADFTYLYPTERSSSFMTDPKEGRSFLGFPIPARKKKNFDVEFKGAAKFPVIKRLIGFRILGRDFFQKTCMQVDRKNGRFVAPNGAELDELIARQGTVIYPLSFNKYGFEFQTKTGKIVLFFSRRPTRKDPAYPDYPVSFEEWKEMSNDKAFFVADQDKFNSVSLNEIPYDQVVFDMPKKRLILAEPWDFNETSSVLSQFLGTRVFRRESKVMIHRIPNANVSKNAHKPEGHEISQFNGNPFPVGSEEVNALFRMGSFDEATLTRVMIRLNNDFTIRVERNGKSEDIEIKY